MSLFLRIFQHLLPRAQAWRLTTSKTLRSFFGGLAAGDVLQAEDGQALTTETGRPIMATDGFLVEARATIDLVFDDIFPDRTRLLDEWERLYGLQADQDEETRRLELAAEWSATGGQSPSYIQGVLQTAGFDVYVHEWWSSGPNPYVARDPRDYTTSPLIGTVQCTGVAYQYTSQPQCTPAVDGDGNALAQPLCNGFLANDPHYFANKNLTRTAPPPVPDDQSRWPYFIYIAGETFPDEADVPSSRKQAFERLLQKLKPAEQWIVTLVNYTDS